MKKIKIVFILLTLVVLVSCNYNPKAGTTEQTATTGNTKIAVDESFQLLLDTEVFTFEAIYQYAHVTPLYLPELDVIDQFM